jgi:hypothetical protein
MKRRYWKTFASGGVGAGVDWTLTVAFVVDGSRIGTYMYEIITMRMKLVY